MLKIYNKQGEEISKEESARLCENDTYKIVRQDYVGGYFISTVWLGIDHNLDENDDTPIIFETMIFQNDDWNELYCERYATEDEALKNHYKLINKYMPNKNSNNLTNCKYCDSCDYCYFCNSCYYCDSCNYSKGLKMSEKMIFCLGEGEYKSNGEGYQKNYKAFNKDISEDRYYEILNEVRKILEDIELNLEENNWEEEWKKVSKEQWLKLSKIPEFDKKVVEGIIGFELDLEEETLSGQEVEVKVGGKTYKAIIQ